MTRIEGWLIFPVSDVRLRCVVGIRGLSGSRWLSTCCICLVSREGERLGSVGTTRDADRLHAYRRLSTGGMQPFRYVNAYQASTLCLPRKATPPSGRDQVRYGSTAGSWSQGASLVGDALSMGPGSCRSHFVQVGGKADEDYL